MYRGVRQGSQRTRSRVAVLLGACMLLGVQVLPAHAATPVISAFYTTTKMVYDKWDHRSFPVRTFEFPTRTSAIAGFFRYGDSAARTDYQLRIYDPKGKLYLQGTPKAISAGIGNQMFAFTHKPAFGPGRYRLDLMIGKIKASETIFIINAR